jgi:hypothetical protein
MFTGTKLTLLLGDIVIYYYYNSITSSQFSSVVRRLLQFSLFSTGYFNLAFNSSMFNAIGLYRLRIGY